MEDMGLVVRRAMRGVSEAEDDGRTGEDEVGRNMGVECRVGGGDDGAPRWDDIVDKSGREAETSGLVMVALGGW
jgi:hypothetical protein